MILLLSGCLTLDFLIFGAPEVDSYAFDNELVPDELIEVVPFESLDGTQLYGAWAHQPVADRPVLVFFHGRGANMEGVWDRVEFYWGWGYEVFVFDYRGFGASEGESTAAGVLEMDGLAAVRFVSEWTGQPPESIDWVSLSLGASVATHTSDEIGAHAIVLESMFASADYLVDSSASLDFAPGWFWAEEFDNVREIAKITAPVLIVHGLADDFIDPDSALQLYAAAPAPKQLWRPEGVGHADLHEVEPEAFTARALDFFANPTEQVPPPL
ncbi:MAG: alpha/beta hydrolase [Myxococcota bacterium]